MRLKQKLSQISTAWDGRVWVHVVAVLLLGLGVFALGLFWGPETVQSPPGVQNNDTQAVEGRVVRVIETRQEEVAPGQVQPVQRLLVQVNEGPLRDEQFEVEHGQMTFTNETSLYRTGDEVMLMITTRPNGDRVVMVAGYVRTRDLLLLGVVFVAFTLLVSGWKGLRALLGLAMSFVVLMGFVLPQILAGRDPVIISVVGSFALLSVTLYLTQGWTLKAHSALFGIFLSLIVAGALVGWSVNLLRLTGYGSEEATLLQSSGLPVNLGGLLMAGMLVGTLGVLDDVVVGQASAVKELADANPGLSWRELYRRAMNVGHDHIAATVNTLVLAYVGAAMPLLLLFRVYPEPWTHTINRDLIAEEVVRTLAGSLGLIASVPITTLIASLLHRNPAMGSGAGRREVSQDVTLRIIYDSNALDRRLQPAHGFACLVEAGGRRILFDTGADGPTLVYNLVALGIEPRDIDAVVLSHEHPGHVGGVEALLNLREGITVYLPAAFSDVVKASLGRRARLVEVSGDVSVGDGLQAFVCEDGPVVEQALLVRTRNGGVLVTGCAHPGVSRMVRQAQQWDTVDMVVGGLHLKDAPDDEIESVSETLKGLGISQVAPAHCTGEKAQWRLRTAFGKGFLLTGVGAEIRVSDPPDRFVAGASPGSIRHE